MCWLGTLAATSRALCGQRTACRTGDGASAAGHDEVSPSVGRPGDAPTMAFRVEGGVGEERRARDRGRCSSFTPFHPALPLDPLHPPHLLYQPPPTYLHPTSNPAPQPLQQFPRIRHVRVGPAQICSGRLRSN